LLKFSTVGRMAEPNSPA